MTVILLTEHHLKFLSSKDGCTGSSESALIKMPHCRKSDVTAHMFTGNDEILSDVPGIIHLSPKFGNKIAEEQPVKSGNANLTQVCVANPYKPS